MIKNIVNYYRRDPIRKEVVQIAWPVFVELMLGAMFGMVDMMMLGQMADKAVAAASIAAVGITNQPVFIGLSLVQALNVGGTALISRYIGAKEPSKVEDTFRHVLLLTLLLFTIPLSFLGFTFAKEIMTFVGAKADTLSVGLSYFKIIMIGFFFQSITFSITAALRGTGNTKVPMRVNLIANFTNVIGNALLIYGLFFFPALGVVGAAVSTAFSNFLGLVLMIISVKKANGLIRLNLSKPFKIDKIIIANIVQIGVPASLEQLVLRFGLLIFTKIVSSLGTVTYAAHQIAISIMGLSFNPGQAFGISAATLVGRNLGAKNPQKAETCVRESIKIGLVISIFMSSIFFFFGAPLCRLYSNDPAIISAGAKALRLIAMVQPFQVVQLIESGGLRGAGDTIWTLIATFTGILGIRSVLAYIFVAKLGFGLNGAWMAVVMDQFVRWLIIQIRFNSNKWKNITIR